MRAQLLLGGALLLSPLLAWAQLPEPDDPAAAGPPPLSITYVDGNVDVARDSGLQPAQVPDLLSDGDRLLTNAGRAELVFADGSVVHVDRDSDLRIDGGARLRLVRGHVVVHTSAAPAEVTVAVPAGLVRLDPRGEYDLSADDLDGDTIVGTIRGEATLLAATTDIRVAPDTVLQVDPRDPRPRWGRAYALRSPLGDWAASRMNETTAALRSQPLPPPLEPYAEVFAQHGYWSTVAPYGQVWYPAVVAGWRPYSSGSWRYTRYGWTWIDSDPWGWPVHHYGRWGRRGSGAWFWIPQRTWGPAWVSWAIGADHIGWAPLGWDSRPVVDFFAGARIGPIDVWASTWSLVPRQSFGIRGLIGPHFTDLRHLPRPVLGGFVVQSHQPRVARDSWRGGAQPSWARQSLPRLPHTEPVRPPQRRPGATAPGAGWARPRDDRDAARHERSTLPAPTRGGYRDEHRALEAAPGEPAARAERTPAPAYGGVYARPRRERDGENRTQAGRAGATSALPSPSNGDAGSGGWTQRRAESGSGQPDGGGRVGRGEARPGAGASGGGPGPGGGRGRESRGGEGRGGGGSARSGQGASQGGGGRHGGGGGVRRPR